MADNNRIGSMASNFGEPDKPKSIIKVIGVGGGGGNAVNHMYREGIHNVNFVLCNTDQKALEDSPVPVHLQLGKEGLGAGNKPIKAQKAAEESEDAIRNMLDDGTKMVFITAGMGGGTGTGAAPVVARIAKNMDILTVGIVTIPFKWEGKKKIIQAIDGVEKMAENVDAMLVINNERLFSIYSDLSVEGAFAKADDTLSIAAKSIAEIITMHGIINLDFNDVKTVLKDGGVALMSTGYGEGENRVKKAIEDALHSPLLNDNDVYHSKKLLLSVWFGSSADGKDTLMMDEMQAIDKFMEGFSEDIETKWGLSKDPELGKKIKVTILATGFGMKRNKNAELNIVTTKELEDIKNKERDDKNREDEGRIERYYGPDTKGNKHPMPRIHIFSNSDLDNDNLVSLVESMPTYSRTKEQENQINSASKDNKTESSQRTTVQPTSTTIKFA